MDSENMKIVEHERQRAQEQSLILYRDSDQVIEGCRKEEESHWVTG